jgi:hypothetical protein
MLSVFRNPITEPVILQFALHLTICRLRCGGLHRLLDLVSDSALGSVLLETPNAPRIHLPNTPPPVSDLQITSPPLFCRL